VSKTAKYRNILAVSNPIKYVQKLY